MSVKGNTKFRLQSLKVPLIVGAILSCVFFFIWEHQVDLEDLNTFLVQKNVEPLPEDIEDRCIPPYFPEEALDLKELKLCKKHATTSKFLECEEDESCLKCMQKWKWPLFEPADALTNALKNNVDDMKRNFTTILSERGVKVGDSIVVMVLNHGYFYHFANWYCSTQKNKIEVRSHTLVIVFDKETRQRVLNLGFMVYLVDWYGVEKKAAARFGRGAHFYIMAVEHAVRNYLIQLDYDVLFQDCDTVWKRHPFKWLKSKHPHTDLQVMWDGRRDDVGPANVGFIYMRSNCRTKIFLQTMTNNLIFFIWAGSSQLYMNSLYHLRIFRQLSMRLMDEDLFVNGHMWSPDEGPKTKLDPIMWHASWTSDHLDKIQKWNVIDEWYLNPTCDAWDVTLLHKKVCERIVKETHLDIDCSDAAPDP